MNVTICYVGGEMMEGKFMCLAPYQLAGALRDAGHTPAVYEITPDTVVDAALVEHLATYDCVGFSCNSFTYCFLAPIIRALRAAAPHVPTVVGGVHIHHCADDVLEETGATCAVTGEGDHVFAEIVERLAIGQRCDDLPGVVQRSAAGSTGVPNGFPRRRGRELDADLPLPAYDLLPSIPPIIVFESSRGCPFRCTFCSIDLTSKWRAWSADELVERFNRSVALLPPVGSLRNVMFGDDNFATDQTRAASILKKLHAAYPDLILSFETRAREVVRDPVLLETVAAEGIRSSFLYGIECGYDEGLQRVQKKLTVAEVREVARMTNEFGLHEGSVFSYIVGFPWEDRHDRMRTLELADELFERFGVKSTVFYWLPVPSPMTTEFGVQVDYARRFWWRQVQVDMNDKVDDDEAELMAKVNANGNFSDTRIDETGRVDQTSATGRSPRELPRR